MFLNLIWYELDPTGLLIANLDNAEQSPAINTVNACQFYSINPIHVVLEKRKVCMSACACGGGVATVFNSQSIEPGFECFAAVSKFVHSTLNSSAI